MSIGLVAQPCGKLHRPGSAAGLVLLRRGGVLVTARQLLFSGLFAAAFGFLEAVVVVYLRAAVRLAAWISGNALRRYSHVRTVLCADSSDQPISEEPSHLEVLREAATILMLLSVALLTSANIRARAAVFLWTFAIWT